LEKRGDEFAGRIGNQHGGGERELAATIVILDKKRKSIDIKLGKGERRGVSKRPNLKVCKMTRRGGMGAALLPIVKSPKGP